MLPVMSVVRAEWKSRRACLPIGAAGEASGQGRTGHRTGAIGPFRCRTPATEYCGMTVSTSVPRNRLATASGATRPRRLLAARPGRARALPRVRVSAAPGGVRPRMAQPRRTWSAWTMIATSRHRSRGRANRSRRDRSQLDRVHGSHASRRGGRRRLSPRNPRFGRRLPRVSLPRRLRGRSPARAQLLGRTRGVVRRS